MPLVKRKWSSRNGTKKLKGERKQVEEEIQEVVAGIDGCRWFGGSDGDHFWQEAQQASLTILVSDSGKRGDVMRAVVFNPLLFALRGTRTGFTFLTSKISNTIHPDGENIDTPLEEMTRNVSAKERVVGKSRSS